MIEKAKRDTSLQRHCPDKVPLFVETKGRPRDATDEEWWPVSYHVECPCKARTRRLPKPLGAQIAWKVMCQESKQPLTVVPARMIRP